MADSSRLLFSWFGWSFNLTMHVGNETVNFESFQDISKAADKLDSKLEPASDVDIDGVKAAIYFNAIVFVALALIYEILRKYFPNVYATRQKRNIDSILKTQDSDDQFEDNVFFDMDTKQANCIKNSLTDYSLPDLCNQTKPFEWISPVLGYSWNEIREVAGLDAYFYLRYIRMCYRITSITALWGMLILFPVYYTGTNEAVGWYHFSLANVNQGDTLRLWVSTVFMYLFSAFVFYNIRNEFVHFMQLRLDFLGVGDKTLSPQHHYSIMVENVPKELRSDRALYHYFDKLFPGKVYSANILLNLPELEALSVKKRRTVKRLEKSIASYEATRKRPMHIVGRPRITCFDIELVPLKCICCEGVQLHDIEQHGNVTKGKLVDSIQYYTFKLKSLNSEFFLLQKEKKALADASNRSLSTTGWFGDVSRFADMFMEENVSNSLDITFNSEILSRTKKTKNVKDKSIYNADENSRAMEPSDVSVSVGITWKLSEEGEDRTGDDGLMLPNEPKDTIKDVVSIDSLSEQPTSGEANCPTTGEEQSKEANDHGGTSNLKPSPMRRYGSFDKEKMSRKNSYPISSLKKNKSEGDTESHFTSSNSLHDEESPYFSFTQYQSDMDKKKKSNLMSKISVRLGIDFVFYLIKLLNKKMAKTFGSRDASESISGTGFVTFHDLTSVAFAAGLRLTHSPGSLDVKVAPEPRDLNWSNAHLKTSKIKRRETTANILLTLGAIFWSIPLALIQALASANKVAQLPGMGWLLTFADGHLVLLVNSYLPVILLLSLIMLLPIIFEWVAVSYEKRKTKSDIDQSVVGRYFYYQLANIYVSVTAGSMWKSAAEILEHPSYILEILGNSLPTVVGYFIALLVTKILGGLPMIMLRIGALCRYVLLRIMHRKKFLTQRDLDKIYRAEPLLYSFEYPSQLMVIVICFTYACISPVILMFGCLFFFLSLMVYKKQILYVYTPTYESGGALFPFVVDRTILGLICGQLTLIGYSIIRGGEFYQPPALMPLVYFSFRMKRYFSEQYAEPSRKLTLERAIELDENSSVRKGDTPPQVVFNCDYYKQPILTESSDEPLPYRSNRDDQMTVEARLKLAQDRMHMWSKTRKR